MRNQFRVDECSIPCSIYLFKPSFFLFSVVIENCVLCDKAIVRKGSNLKNCLIGSNHEVLENSVKEKAHLTNSDGYMEIE